MNPNWSKIGVKCIPELKPPPTPRPRLQMWKNIRKILQHRTIPTENLILSMLSPCENSNKNSPPPPNGTIWRILSTEGAWIVSAAPREVVLPEFCQEQKMFRIAFLISVVSTYFARQ